MSYNKTIWKSKDIITREKLQKIEDQLEVLSEQEVSDESSGTSDYLELENKPQINGVTLTGNKSLTDLGVAAASDVAAKYTKPGTGIPASDLSNAVQASLNKADTALQGENLTSAVNNYIETNFSNPSSPPLDRTLSSSASAAPADMVGDLKSTLSADNFNVFGVSTPSWTIGRFIKYNEDGYVDGSSTQSMGSDYIEIKAGSKTLTIPMRNTTPTATYGMAFYDSDKIYISGNRDKYNATANTYDIRVLTIPDNAKYFRTTYWTDASPVEHPQFFAFTDLQIDDRFETLTNQLIQTEPVVPANMYNPNDADIEDGKTVSYTGALNTAQGFKVSGFIPIEPGATYIIPRYTMYFGSSDLRYLPCYNDDKTYAGSRDRSSVVDTYFYVYTFPANTTYKYFRVNIATYDANSNRIVSPYHTESCFMVIKGAAMPNRYIPFARQRLADINVYSAHESLDNPLYGKSVVFLGDSIVEGGDDSGYCRRIGELNTMLWLNNGIGGSTIAQTAAGKTICTRDVIMTDPDYIILEGGTNDADRIGDATGETKPEKFGTWDVDNYGTNDATTYYGFDITTFCGAVDYMCKRFVSTYAGKKIGFIGAHKMGQVLTTRQNRGYYIHTAMDICRKWGIPCLDLWDECYLNPMIPSHYTSGEDYLYADGQHLTHNGYDYITPIIAEWMKTL